MNKQGKITLGVLITTVVVSAPLTALVVIEGNKNKESAYKDYNTAEILLRKGMMYNFDHPELVDKKTSTFSREVLRITLNTMRGVGDFSKSFFAKYFTTPAFVPIKEILELIKKPEITDLLFNQLISDLEDIKFYQTYGYKIKKNSFTTLTLSNSSLDNYLKNLNNDFIFEDSLHNLEGYDDLKNGTNNDVNIHFNGTFHPLNTFINNINNADSMLTSLNGHQEWISYKIPKQFLLKIDIQDHTFTPNLTNPLDESVNTVAHYEKYAYLKNINNLMSLIPFASRHRENSAYYTQLPFLYRFQKYDKFYVSMFNENFYKESENIPGRTYYEMHKNGRMWERNITTSDFFSQEILNGNNLPFNKSHVPLNKQIFFDKLHNSQTNKFGIAPTTGSYFGFNDGTYEMNKTFRNNINIFPQEFMSSLNKQGLSKYGAGSLNWNYMNKLIFWNTVSNKNLAIPRADLIDRAHLNGVKVYASYFPQEVPDINVLLYEDFDKNMPAVENMVKLAKSVGFDGYFMNMEVPRNMSSWKNYYYRKKFFARIAKFKAIAKAHGIEIIWYAHQRDSYMDKDTPDWDMFYDAPTFKQREVLIDDQLVYHFNYDDSFNPLKDDANIPGTEAYINTYINFAHHMDPEDVWEHIGHYWYLRMKYGDKNYGGVSWQTWISNSDTGENWSWLLNNIYEIQQYVIGFGKTPHQEWFGDINVYGGEMYWGTHADRAAKCKQNGMMFQELWPASGENGDPRDNNTSAYSKYIQERSVIDGTKSFKTYFNLWVTSEHFQKGKIFKVNNQNIIPYGSRFLSDIKPTYRWITDIYDLNNNPVMWTQRQDFKKEIKTRFKMTDAYNGLNTIGFIGDLPSNNKLENKLYGSNIDNANTDSWDITFKGPITPNLLLWDDSNSKTSVQASSVTDLANGWKKAIYNVSSGITKYFGYSLENSTSASIHIDNEYINGISWNRTGDLIIKHNDELDSLNPSVDQYFDNINNKYYFNVDLGVTYKRDVYYEIYRIEQDKEELVGWNSAGFFRDGINSINSSGLQKYKIISRNHDNDIIGEKTINVIYESELK